jgi:hypothetical protein
MTVELDHVYVLSSVGGPEADFLMALGLTEGQPNRHPGQGTACRRFFFANAYLELLWVEDPREAQNEVTSPLRLWERWSQRMQGACPFGIVFRPGPQGGLLPFPAWEYRPPYLPPSLCMHVGVNSEVVEEPVLLYIPFARRPDSMPAPSRQPLEHKTGFRQVTALRVRGPRGATGSDALRAAAETGAVTFQPNAEYVAEIGFDGERQGQHADLRPGSPLLLCW